MLDHPCPKCGFDSGAMPLQDAALARLLGQLAAVQPGDRDRPALRNNGSRFTMTTLICWLVPDPVHHAHDVAG